jgi:hypothetical protein
VIGSLFKETVLDIEGEDGLGTSSRVMLHHPCIPPKLMCLLKSPLIKI